MSGGHGSRDAVLGVDRMVDVARAIVLVGADRLEGVRARRLFLPLWPTVALMLHLAHRLVGPHGGIAIAAAC